MKVWIVVEEYDEGSRIVDVYYNEDDAAIRCRVENEKYKLEYAPVDWDVYFMSEHTVLS